MINRALKYAVEQAWVGFWHSCMKDAGAESRLPYDAKAVSWRGYDIVVSVPGIHHPSPEAIHHEFLHDDDIPPPSGDGTPHTELADVIQGEIEKQRKVPFRKGKPTARYAQHVLHTPDELRP